MSAQPKNSSTFAPGTLVFARGREWIVLPGSNSVVLRLRPISGSEEDTAVIHTLVEPDVRPATFPAPTSDKEANQADVWLLRDALLMSLRRGAGPFRSFANIAVTPRTDQLVPLMMALKMDPIRLLIGDDVGIGKTIEAGLIAREMLDRGEISRIAVLCPPHLVDQWVQELNDRFHIRATAVTAASATGLERDMPVNESIFTLYPFTVVSLDYIKSQRHRDDFIRACPEFVLVDEAHTCSSGTTGRQQRYQLLRDLAQDIERHLVLLTATPHSGDERAFYRLLGLLDPEFESFLDMPEGAQRDRLREKLSNHFVQRTRRDIEEWADAKASFPVRQVKEITYTLSGEWEAYLDAVLDYCADVTQRGDNELQQRLNFWGTLALVRCVSSSPAAAIQAFRARALNASTEEELQKIEEEVLDGSDDLMEVQDVEMGVGCDAPALQNLINMAEGLSGGKGDPKYALLAKHLKELLKDGFSPVVFCRFIATAHYLRELLRNDFKKVTVEVVTGESPPQERKRKVAELQDEEGPKILVATDCLSEGINLQHGFDAVVHYDLSWNPTRHEQREGRVDRYGQKKPIVRATLIYGENNPVDGAVFQVILRKAESIRKELGVAVPLPDDERKLTQALMKAVILRRGSSQMYNKQMPLFEKTEEASEIEVAWTNHADRTRKNRTIFAQRSLKPADVLPEWERMRSAIGSTDDVRRFIDQAVQRMGGGLAPRSKGGFICSLKPFPEQVRERLAYEGYEERVAMDFDPVPAAGAKFMHRSDPFVGVIAETVLEDTINTIEVGNGSGMQVGRVAVWRSAAVDKVTWVMLIRVRHRLTTVKDSVEKVQLVEEVLPVAICGKHDPVIVTDSPALDLLREPAVGDLPTSARAAKIEELMENLVSWGTTMETIATERAEELAADHSRVRRASNPRNQGAVRTTVKALTPVDIISAVVLIPAQ